MRLRSPTPGTLGLRADRALSYSLNFPDRSSLPFPGAQSHPHDRREAAPRRRAVKLTAVKQGDQGPTVRKIQYLLNTNAGAQLKVDGVFGPRTRDAVIAYQRSAQLQPDGFIGIQTLSRLAFMSTPAVTPAAGFRATAPGLPPSAGLEIRSLTPKPAPRTRSADIHEWPVKDIIIEVLKRTGSHLPDSLRAQWAQIISPSSLEMMAGSIAIVVAAHAVGIGEAADVVMLGVGIVFLGAAAFEGGKELGAFIVTIMQASTEEDLDRAAEHLAQAIVLLGITAVMTWLLKRAPTEAREGSEITSSDQRPLQKPPARRPALEKKAPQPESEATAGVSPEEPQAAGASMTSEASPAINPQEIAGKNPEQIDQISRNKGLIPKGPDPKNGKGAYIDPVTGKQRVLIHPVPDSPHAHVNDPHGNRLDINGSVVDPDSPDAHLPLGGV